MESTPPPVAGPLPRVHANVQLMQDYRRVTPAKARSGFTVAANADGGAELYTLDALGKVWRLFQDPTSDTGWTLADLSYPNTAGAIAALNTPSGMSLWAWNGQSLDTWSTATNAWLPVPRLMAHPVTAMRVGWDGQTPLLSLFPTNGNPTAVDILAVAPGPLADYPASISQAVSDFVPGRIYYSDGSIVRGGYFAASGGVGCVNAATAQSALAVGAGEKYVAVAAPLNPATGVCDLLAIDASGDVIYFDNITAPGTFTPQSIALAPDGSSPGWKATALSAAYDGVGKLHAVVVASDGTLYHIAQNAADAGGWQPAAGLTNVKGLSAAEVVTTAEGGLEVFALVSDGSLFHGAFDVSSGAWTVEAVEVDVPTTDSIEQITSYSAHLNVTRANGLPAVGFGVTIQCTDRVLIQIDSSEVLLAPESPWRGAVGPDGHIDISYETEALAAPVLMVAVEGMPAGAYVAVDLGADVRNTVAQAAKSGSTLATVQTATGNKLSYSESLLFGHIDQDSADQLASVLSQVIGVAVVDEGEPQSPITSSSQPGVLRYFPAWDGTPPNRIQAARVPETHFHLFSNDAGGLVCRTLDATSASSVIASLRAGADSDGESWWESWGDVVAQVAAGVAQVFDVAVTTITEAGREAISGVITLLYKGKKYVVDAIFDTLDALADLLQIVLAKLGLGVSKVFGWLGWVFDWSNILRTHQALAFMASSGIGLAQDGLQALADVVDTQISQFQTKIQGAVQSFIQANVPSGTKLGSDTQTLPLPSGAAGGRDPRNVFERAARTNLPQATMGSSTPSQPSIAAGSDAVGIAQQLQPSLSGAPSTMALSAALLPSGDSVSLSQDAATILTMAGDAAVEALGLVQSAAGQFFTYATTGIEAVMTEVAAPWNVPLLTDIYHWITNDSDLSGLDVSCLLLAIPTTISYKALFGAPPVPNTQTLNDLKSCYPTAKAGVAAMTRARPIPDAGAPSSRGDLQGGSALKLVQQLGALGLAAGSFASAVLNSWNDLSIAIWNDVNGGKLAQPRVSAENRGEWWAQQLGKVPASLLVITELANAGFSAAVTVVPNAGAWDCETGNSLANYAFVISAMPAVIDAFVLWLPGCPGELMRACWDGGGAGLSLVFGVFIIMMQASAWGQGGSSWLGNLPTLLSAVPLLAKVGITPQADWATDEVPISAAFTAACDVFFNAAAGGFWVVYATSL